MEVIRVEERAEEEEDRVGVAIRLSATIMDNRGTMSVNARILHACHVNIADSLTILR